MACPSASVTPRGRAAQADAARAATPQLLARLEEYTGIPYPFDKLDHLALIEGAFGAIENPGLITYRQKRSCFSKSPGMRGTMAHGGWRTSGSATW